MVKRREWLKVLPAILAAAQAPLTMHSKLMALTLWAEDRGAISHLSAALLWHLRVRPPSQPEVTVTDNRRAPRAGVTIHHSALPRVDITNIGLLRVTTVARTLVDLAACLDEEQLEVAMDDACRRGLVTWPRLAWQAERTCGRGRRGSPAIRSILAARSAAKVRASGLETRLGRALRGGGLEPPRSQYSIAVDGRFAARVDFAWPLERIGIECESYEWHSGRQEWAKDARRLNDVTAGGWLILRATEEDVKDPRPLIQKLRRLLQQRGQGRFG
jgi:very-short-patch-repair endonuclease